MNIYHVEIKRPDGSQLNADQTAANLVMEKARLVEGVGGSLYVSRTFNLESSTIVLLLPDGQTPEQFFTEGVTPHGPAPVVSTTEQPDSETGKGD